MLCRLGGSPQYGPSGLMPYQFKGGRYGLAVELQKSEFPAFSKLVLGELCHLVQLAINGGLLAYERRSIDMSRSVLIQIFQIVE